MKLNEEATRYLQDFPEEMIFHTSNLHMLDVIGQGKTMCAHVFNYWQCSQVCAKLDI